MNPRRLIRYWMSVILWMTLIFVMSSSGLSAEHTSSVIEPALRVLLPFSPQHTLDAIHLLIRKCGHLLEYFILGLLLARAFRAEAGHLPASQWIVPTAIALLTYALTDEGHQIFVPGRTASPLDVLIDCLGGLLAVALYAARLSPAANGAAQNPGSRGPV